MNEYTRTIDHDNQDPEEGRDTFEPLLTKTMPDFDHLFEGNLN